jgi:hypothetical protein
MNDQDYQYRVNQIVDALQFRRDNWDEMKDFIGDRLGDDPSQDVIVYFERYGESAGKVVGLQVPKELNPSDHWVAHLNDYIVRIFKHPANEFYVVPSHIFEALFQKCHENDFRG